MNTLLKLTLILFAIFCFALSALIFFAQSRVPNPPSMPVADKVFSGYLSNEIRNFPEKSGVRLWRRWFDKVLYEVDRSAEEGFISAEERDDNVLRSFSIYVPKFVGFSLGEFDKLDWEWSPVPNDDTKLTDFIRVELGKLANNKYDIKVSTYENFDVVSSTIRDYLEAKNLVRESYFQGRVRTVEILKKRDTFLKNEYLCNNSALVNDLNSLPDRIRSSHKRSIMANQIRSFQPDYESYLEKVSEFRSLWKGLSPYSEVNELLSPACAFLNAYIYAINKQSQCSKDLYYTILGYAQNYPGSKSDLHQLKPSYCFNFSY
ncbi:MAG: hypothetical protein ACI35Q_04310 [Marinilabiliaceae bacterium]